MEGAIFSPFLTFFLPSIWRETPLARNPSDIQLDGSWILRSSDVEKTCIQDLVTLSLLDCHLFWMMQVSDDVNLTGDFTCQWRQHEKMTCTWSFPMRLARWF